MVEIKEDLVSHVYLCFPGVDVNCVNHMGQTPLFCAALSGQAKVTKLLLHHGADPNQ